MDFSHHYYFSSLDDFLEGVRTWNLDFRQLDRGNFKGTLLQHGFEEAQVGITALSRKFDQRGQAPENLISFALLDPESPPVVWRGAEVDHHKVMVYGMGDEIDCASEPGFKVVTYSISERMLSTLWHDLGIHRPMKTIKRNKVVPISTRSRKAIRDAIATATCNLNPDGAGIVTELARHALETTIPSLILSSIAETQDLQIRRPLTKRRRKALEAIDQRLASSPIPPMTIQELCQVAGVSERTLQYLFKQKYGITPKAYIKLIRLNGVRRMLHREDSLKSKIADIANDWGFWHMGQFAKDYRQYFGELPSATLRRRPLQWR
jgi:AraC family transcriptional regulator, ethanolamine operon transcriptional activator